MKSTKNKNQSFSIEDFEQGLILAGLVTPSSSKEQHELELLVEYESSNLKSPLPKDNTFFKRVTLAAEIVSQLHGEPTFGRIKFQKLVFLCEHAASMELTSRYSKQVAGPFDNKFMHSIEKQFTKNNWFKVEKIQNGKYNRSVYIPLENINDYKKFYNGYFSTHTEKIQYIIDLFRTSKTDTTEIAATLYACIIELLTENSSITEENILTKFYGWSDAKTRFDRKNVLEILSWMKSKQVIPII